MGVQRVFNAIGENTVIIHRRFYTPWFYVNMASKTYIYGIFKYINPNYFHWKPEGSRRSVANELLSGSLSMSVILYKAAKGISHNTIL